MMITLNGTHTPKESIAKKLTELALVAQTATYQTRSLYMEYAESAFEYERLRLIEVIRNKREQLARAGECALYYLLQYEEAGATIDDLKRALGTARGVRQAPDSRPERGPLLGELARLVHVHHALGQDAPLNIAISAYLETKRPRNVHRTHQVSFGADATH